MLISLKRRQCVSAAAAMLCSQNSNSSSPLLPPQKLRCWAKNHFSSLESHKCLSGKLFSHEINARTNTRTLLPSLLPSLLHTRIIKNGSIWRLWSLLKCHNCCLLLTFKQMKCEKSITHNLQTFLLFHFSNHIRARMRGNVTYLILFFSLVSHVSALQRGDFKDSFQFWMKGVKTEKNTNTCSERCVNGQKWNYYVRRLLDAIDVNVSVIAVSLKIY